MSPRRPASSKELQKALAKGVAARLLAVLVGRRVTIAASVFALGACVVEIARDLEVRHTHVATCTFLLAIHTFFFLLINTCKVPEVSL